MNEYTHFFNDYGISPQKADPVYFDEGALREPSYKLMRLDRADGANRWYYTLAEDRVHYFASVTTVLKATLPTSPFLIDWKVQHGDSQSEYLMQSAAAYGTLMHMQAESLLINRTYDLDNTPVVVEQYCQEHGFKELALEWSRRLKKDMLSMAAFIRDYKVKPLAIEVMLASEQMGVAGAVDLLCEMSIQQKGFYGEVYKSGPRKGQPKQTKQEKRIVAIVDFKSSTKGNFYESHEIQLHLYKRMVAENFGIDADHVYNWSPKDWSSEPGYSLKDQTQAKSAAKIEHLLACWRVDHPEGKPSELLDCHGVLDLDQDLSLHYERKALDEMLADYFNQVMQGGR